jgi:hypothetical protein
MLAPCVMNVWNWEVGGECALELCDPFRRALTSTGISSSQAECECERCYSGMPYPPNFETAKEVEAIVRESGAVPATIAILDGVACIGTAST